MRRATRAVAVALILGGCGGSQRDVVPRLPGEGSKHTAAPQAGKELDPWAGRDLIHPPGRIEPQPLVLPPFERFALKSGLQVIAIESADAPTFSAQLAIRSGRQSEPRDKVGLSSFVAAMLPKGAGGRGEAQVTSALEQAGAQLSSNASFEALLISCHAPAAGQAACLETVAAMAAAPSFPASAMGGVREQLLAAARQNFADPAQLASLQFQNALWGDAHVRGVPLSERSVGAIQRADLLAWYRTYSTPTNAVLVVVSGRKPAALRAALESTFGRWHGAAPKAAPPAPEPEVKGIQIRLVDAPGSGQAQIRVGRPGLAHRDPDFYAATVVNYILGGGSDRSRMALAVHKTLGGQASATTSFDRNLERGAFVATAAAGSGQAVAAMRVLLDQIGQMAASGPREDEVRAAASELAGQYMTRLSSHQEVAGALLAAELHGLGPDYVRNFAVEISKVDVAAARASAARWLDGKNLVVVLAGNAKELEPQLAEAGLKFEKVAAGAAGRGERDAAQEAAAPVDPKKEAAGRAILDAALAAKGGAGKLAALKTLTWKGKATVNLPGGQVPAQVEKRFVTPDKLRLDMQLEMGGQKMAITTVLAGDKGWAQEVRPDGTKAIDFPPGEIEAGKAQIWRDQDFVLLRHREKGAKVMPLDDVERDGAPHHAVKVTSGDGKRTVTLFVDKKSKRLTGKIGRAHV